MVTIEEWNKNGLDAISLYKNLSSLDVIADSAN